MINKELITRILNENGWGLFLKNNPLEEMPSSLGKMYKVSEIDVDRLVEEYNAHLESPEE